MTVRYIEFYTFAGLIVFIAVMAILGSESKEEQEAPYECPAGTELIRGEQTGWFCAVRPTVKVVK